MSKGEQRRMAKVQPRKADGEHPFLRLIESVEEAENLRLARKLDRARAVCATVLKEEPEYVAALFTMGLILADQSQFEKAVGYLHRALMFNPHDPKILTALSGVYIKLGSSLMAARTLEQARKISPDDPNILITLGEIYREEKEYEFAKDAYERALAVDPTRVDAEMGLAQNLNAIGHLAEAAALFEKRIKEGNRSLHCLYNLSQLPASLVNIDLPSLLADVKPGPGVDADAFHSRLDFARAAAFDKAGQHNDAWVQVCKARRYGNAEKRHAYKSQRERHTPLLELARSTQLDGERAETVSPDYPFSLFIAGPSRSGKTTLERLVGSLEGVKRGYENPIVENAVRRSFQMAAFPTRSLLVQMPPGLNDLFRSFYLEELARRAGSAKVMTNTLPQRTEDALRAATEIPNARFVFVKRDIDDQTIRIFMRDYKSGNFYASDVRDIRDYLQWCHEMIDVTAEKLPASMYRVVTYEELVDDPAHVLTEVAALCGMDADGAALPPTGDDRGCAVPYRDYLREAVNSK